MATKLSAALDRMRRHLGDSIPDSGARQRADGLLRDILQAMQEGPGEEDEGERPRDLAVPGESSIARTGYDHRGAVGLDHMAFDRKPPGAISSSLAKVLAGASPPRSVGGVR